MSTSAFQAGRSVPPLGRSTFNRGRDDVIDAARGISMLFVLYGHALEILFVDRSDHVFLGWAFLQYKAIYSFHMPLFFLLSGAVQRDIQNKTFRQVAFRATTLLLITFCIHEIGVLIFYFDRVEQLDGWELLKWSVGPVLKGSHFSVPVLWFVVTLAIVQLLFWMLVAVRSAYGYIALGLVAGASAFLSLRLDLPDYFQIQIWIPAFVFFGLGWCLSRLSVTLPIILAAPCAIGVLVLFDLNHGCPFSISGSCPIAHLDGHFAVHMIQGAIGNLSLFYVTALLGSISIISLARVLRPRPLTWIGRNSLEVFIANGFVLAFFNPVLRAMPIPAGTVYPLVFIGVGLIVNVIVVAALGWPVRLIARAAKSVASPIIQPSLHAST